MRSVHADALALSSNGRDLDPDPYCATCHRQDCPRYWRIQERLEKQAQAFRSSTPKDWADLPW